MITLFSFGTNLGVADPSPFVLKIDTYLRMSGIEFESVAKLSNLSQAPKGKLPYIKDNDNIIADSFFILQYLKENYPTPLEDGLSPEQRATQELIIKSLDENFYWCIVYSRWIQEDTWPTIKQCFFDSMPFPLKIIARKSVKSTLQKQGIGRHSTDEIMAIAKNTLESLSQLLGDKNYFFGDKPSTLDAVAYAFLVQVTLVELDNALTHLGRSYTNLLSYSHRLQQQYYT